MRNKPITALLLLGVSLNAHSIPFTNGNAETGKKIFSQHKCSSCHVKQLGGDGSKMFTRSDRKVKSPASLATQITRCSNNLGLMLFEDDEEHLGAYLNKNYYKFE